MPIVFVLFILAVIAVIAVVAAGRGDAMARVDPDNGALLPGADGAIVAADVDSMRFSLAFRGYRMDEVDDVLDRLAGELADRDRRIAELEHRLGDGVPGGQAAVPGAGSLGLSGPAGGPVGPAGYPGPQA